MPSGPATIRLDLCPEGGGRCLVGHYAFGTSAGRASHALELLPPS